MTPSTTPPINGLPTLPLGYTWLNKGERLTSDCRYCFSVTDNDWIPVPETLHYPAPNLFYCRPEDDNYTYHETETTIIQKGDQPLLYNGTWGEYRLAIGDPNLEPLRRPKAIPPTYAERQAACGLKVGDWVKVTRVAEDQEDGWHNAWASNMDRDVGKEYVIHKIHETEGLKLDCGFSFPYFVLEKVSPQRLPLTSSDWSNGPWWVREGNNKESSMIIVIAKEHIAVAVTGTLAPQILTNQFLMDNGWERSKDLITWEPCISNWRELDDN